MEFRILGPLEVLEDGQALDLGGQKQRACSPSCSCRRTRSSPRDRLIEALWEEEPPATAEKALQVYVSQLRKPLGKERLQTKAPGYLLRVEPDELDLERFRALAGGGRGRSEALALWRGPPLADFGVRALRPGRDRPSRGAAAAALEERIERDLAPGRHAELVGELEALVAKHPLRERLRGAADARALPLRAARRRRSRPTSRRGRAARRRARDRARARAARAPQAILQQDPALDARPGRRAEPSMRHRSAFVGREAELGRAARRARRRLRRAAAACSCSSASPASARAASRTS